MVPSSPRRILIIEDNHDARAALTTALRVDAHHVTEAQTGREGVALARNLRPDVVLVDIGLPDIDGYEVARLIRQDLGGGVRVAALTGYGQEADRRRALDAGFDAHLVKPASADAIAAFLAS